MIVFSTFLDGSGHQDDVNSQVVTVGGCASSEDKWERFEKEWRAALKAEGVTLFHMKHFAHSTGEFKAWRGDEQRRQRFIKSLHKVILARTTKRFSATIFLEHYRAVNKMYPLREVLGQPFTIAAQFVMTAVNLWMVKHHPNDGMLYIFESGDTDQGEVAQMAKLLTFLAVQPIFMDKTATAGVPLQAADFVAYEHAKTFNDFLKTGKKRVRKSASPLMPRRNDQGIRFIDTRMLQGMCHDMRIPRRRP